MKTDTELAVTAGFELLIDGRISCEPIEKGDCDQEVRALIRVVREETLREMREDLTTLAGGRLPGDPGWYVESAVYEWAQGWLERLGA